MNETISFSDPIGSQTLQIIAKADQFNHWMYSEFKSQLKGEILEAGSGIGNVSQMVVEEGLSITLSDYNAEYCEWLNKKFRDEPLVKDIIQINLLRPDFKIAYPRLKEKFDSIFLLNVIEHLENDSKAVANCNFMMKPGGHLIVLAPAYQWLYCRMDKELGHYRRYSLKNLKKVLVKEGFEVRSVKHFNFLGIGGWLLAGKILKRKKLGNDEMNVFNNLVPFARIMDKITLKKIGLSIICTGIKPNN